MKHLTVCFWLTNCRVQGMATGGKGRPFPPLRANATYARNTFSLVRNYLRLPLRLFLVMVTALLLDLAARFNKD